MAGISLRLVRSPPAPNITITQGPGGLPKRSRVTADGSCASMKGTSLRGDENSRRPHAPPTFFHSSFHHAHPSRQSEPGENIGASGCRQGTDTSGQRLLNRLLQPRQTGGQVSAKVNAKHAAISLGEDLEVSAR